MNEITKGLGLGKMLSEPERITGGLLHRMDKVRCESGVYALKTLNPLIMKRPEALGNMVRSERIARALKNTVPVVHALENRGECVYSLGENHYMLYPWVEGKSVFPPDITIKQCTFMGDILGRIHEADIQLDGIEKIDPEEVRFDWAKLPEKAAWLDVMFDNRAKIEKWQSVANESMKVLSSRQVISHRDLDPKNVLWQEDKPLLIDWEAAGYVNPYQEMLETAYYWADDGRGSLNEGHFKAFVTAYGQHIPLFSVCWQTVFSACFQGMLGWLYYNALRSCGMENENDKDMALGKQQVYDTMISLKAMDEKNLHAARWIKEI